MKAAAKIESIMSQSLLRYLKHRNGLPDPRANSVSSRAISRANDEVEAELERQKKENGKKRGPYRRYLHGLVALASIMTACFVYLKKCCALLFPENGF